MCEIDKQRVHVILQDNIKNMQKEIDDMEVPSVDCVSHTPLEGLLSQCSITASPANTRKVVGQCCITKCSRVLQLEDENV